MIYISFSICYKTFYVFSNHHWQNQEIKQILRIQNITLHLTNNSDIY